MKQKVVIRLQINDQKGRSKAMKIAVGHEGVVSASIEGKDNDQIVVIGEGVDSINLTRSLRKGMKFAELITVSAVDAKKEDPKKEEKTPGSTNTVVWPAPCPGYQGYAPQPYFYAVQERDPDPCTIM